MLYRFSCTLDAHFGKGRIFNQLLCCHNFSSKAKLCFEDFYIKNLQKKVLFYAFVQTENKTKNYSNSKIALYGNIGSDITTMKSCESQKNVILLVVDASYV